MMLHPTVAQHAVSGLGPWTVQSRAVGKFVEGLAQKLGGRHIAGEPGVAYRFCVSPARFR
jgi:hypothetical protein